MYNKSKRDMKVCPNGTSDAGPGSYNIRDPLPLNSNFPPIEFRFPKRYRYAEQRKLYDTERTEGVEDWEQLDLTLEVLKGKGDHPEKEICEDEQEDGPIFRPNPLIVHGFPYDYLRAGRVCIEDNKQPFNMTSSRFAKFPIDNFPGPGQYKTPNGLHENIEERYVWGKKDCFGFLRTFPLSKTRKVPSIIFPGPPHYNKQEPKCDNKFGRQTTKPFANKEKRGFYVFNKNPAVGDYNIACPWDRLTKRHDYWKPSRCRSYQIGFNCSAFRDVFPWEHCIVPKTAAPGRYELRGELDRGVSIPRSKRFKDPILSNLGPTTHHLNPYYVHTCAKKTFNHQLSKKELKRLKNNKFSYVSEELSLNATRGADDCEMLGTFLIIHPCEPCTNIVEDKRRRSTFKY